MIPKVESVACFESQCRAANCEVSGRRDSSPLPSRLRASDYASQKRLPRHVVNQDGMLGMRRREVFRTTDIDSSEPLLAEQGRYGAPDLSPTIRALSGFHGDRSGT